MKITESLFLARFRKHERFFFWAKDVKIQQEDIERNR